MEQLLEISLKNKEMNSFNYALDGVLGEYLEGYMERSKDVFNKYWRQLNFDQKRDFVRHTVFDNLEIFERYK